MTAIVKRERGPEPPQTRAGYLWPGLGHLLVGEVLHGLGMMAITAVVVASAVFGLPDVRALVFPASGITLVELCSTTGALLTTVGSALLLKSSALLAGGLSAALGIGLKVFDRTTRLIVVAVPVLGWIGGAALCLLAGALLSAAGTGLPAVPGIGWIAQLPLGLHAILAFLGLPVTAGVLWFRAHRRVVPRVLSEQEYNGNRAVFLRQMRRHRTGMLGFYGITLLLLITLFTPLLAPFDPDVIDVGPKTVAPGWWQHAGFILGVRDEAATHGFTAFPMGTDERGRDVLSRLLFGGRISLLIGFLAVGIAATTGTIVGATAGFLGGWADRLLMWVVDLLLAMPRLILLLAVVGIIDVGGVFRLLLIVVILGLTGWMGVSRIVRSQVLSLKQQDFIQAARALGYGQVRIVLRHLIPNAMAPVIVYCSLAIGGTMLAEAGLSFLGLGVQPPTSTWGVMVNEGRDPLRQAPWISLFPGIAIVLAVMCFNLLGDGLRDALDPKQRT